jgi:hypothetical protein
MERFEPEVATYRTMLPHMGVGEPALTGWGGTKSLSLSCAQGRKEGKGTVEEVLQGASHGWRCGEEHKWVP